MIDATKRVTLAEALPLPCFNRTTNNNDIMAPMKSPPVVRQEVFDLYWYFASERQRVFERRVSDENWPWTNDPILQTFKFCCVFRACDRVSQYMIRAVAHDSEHCSPEDRLFQIIAFRTFSKIETWEAVRIFLGRQPIIEDLRSDAFARALGFARERNGGLYTGAFILCATDAYGKSVKHLNHVELFRHMFIRDCLGTRLLTANSLKDIFDLLHQYPLMGDFMSYQTAIDLNYSDLINFSENDFTQPGPGAIRGIRKAFLSLGDYSPIDIIHWMVDRQDVEFARLGYKFGGLWGRPLHAIDCQGLFCETDKYCRQALPELASARKRIKARFSVSPEPLQLFFPPKWGINSKVPRESVLGTRSLANEPHPSLF